MQLQYSFGESLRGLEQLEKPQAEAVIEALSSREFSYSKLKDVDTDECERVRATHPSLSSLSDDDISAAFVKYVETPPTLQEALFMTPIGPVFLLNLILLATGFSVCDTPFADTQSTACLEVAARAAAAR